MMIDRQFISHRYIRGQGIEIGAFHNPFPVNPQMKVTYVDRYPYEHLANWRDRDESIRGKEITRVDVIDDGMFLNAFANESQDFVLSSHHLEHCWNPIVTIFNHLRVLKKDGVIFYAVPDKRFTFDKKRPLSKLSDVQTIFQTSSESDVARQILINQWEEYLHLVDGLSLEEARKKARYESDPKSLDIHWFCWDAIKLVGLISLANDLINIAIDIDIELFARAGHENFVVLRKL